ncbi:unnamed protein product [Vicia faba]|uniref:Uncharacterized protein n=1 Tax=Vicia faba TaxID=3906 RepID=A0AAV1AI64_VICFA|nr:unnamed protein product [Vicia faba]
MFMGTLTGPFFNLLIGSSLSGFTELILTGERVERDIKSGKIPMTSASASNTVKKPFHGKKKTNATYGERADTKKDHRPSVNVVLISNPPSAQRQSSNNQQSEVPRRQLTRISMSLSQALQHLLKANLVTLRDPPSNPNISSPKYNLNAKCAYHSNSPEHKIDQCWALKNKIQDLIDHKTIEFYPPATPNVITAPMLNHGKGVNSIDDTTFVSSIEDLTTH